MNLEENSTTIEKEGESFFFDTYAFYEILNGNKYYRAYVNSEIVTSKLNIFELYLIIMRDTNEEKAEEALAKYYGFCEDFDEVVIKNAVKMKRELNKRKLSMTDCIGYMMARQLGIKFLTGDEQFKDMENVEFLNITRDLNN